MCQREGRRRGVWTESEGGRDGRRMGREVQEQDVWCKNAVARQPTFLRIGRQWSLMSQVTQPLPWGKLGGGGGTHSWRAGMLRRREGGRGGWGREGGMVGGWGWSSGVRM